MQANLITSIVLLLISTILSGQKFDQNYFISPIQDKIRLSGSFGELRPGHFHSGLDIRSKNGKEGDPIFVVADGHISRIKVQSSGYGLTLYIDHPNGYTTVYAHLQKFMPEVAQYVKKEQYRQKSYSLDIYPDSTQFVVKQGSQIGYMGNSGRSFGPHLHFEIRNTKTEVPINPMHFGIKPTDHRKPHITSLRVYDFDSKKVKTNYRDYQTFEKSKREYELLEDTIFVYSPFTKLAIQTFDRMDGSYNKNGTYSIQNYVNDTLIFKAQMDSVGFHETHFINCHLDYAARQKEKKYYTYVSKSPMNKLQVLDNEINKSEFINLSLNEQKRCTIIVKDFDGNERELSFILKRKKSTGKKLARTGNYFLQRRAAHLLQKNKTRVYIPDSSLIDNQYFYFDTTNEKKLTTWHLGNVENGLLKKVTLHIDSIESIDSSLYDKTCLLYCSNKTPEVIQGKISRSSFSTELSSFGDYTLVVDTVPPTIEAIHFQTDMTKKSFMTFRIKDNFQPKTSKERLKVEGRIDGIWVVFSYDLKSDTITYHFDENCPPGKHELSLKVKDHLANERIFKSNFQR